LIIFYNILYIDCAPMEAMTLLQTIMGVLIFIVLILVFILYVEARSRETNNNAKNNNSGKNNPPVIGPGGEQWIKNVVVERPATLLGPGGEQWN